MLSGSVQEAWEPTVYTTQHSPGRNDLSDRTLTHARDRQKRRTQDLQDTNLGHHGLEVPASMAAWICSQRDWISAFSASLDMILSFLAHIPLCFSRPYTSENGAQGLFASTIKNDGVILKTFSE